jgi:hypothetical protein
MEVWGDTHIFSCESNQSLYDLVISVLELGSGAAGLLCVLSDFSDDTTIHSVAHICYDHHRDGRISGMYSDASTDGENYQAYADLAGFYDHIRVMLLTLSAEIIQRVLVKNRWDDDWFEV